MTMQYWVNNIREKLDKVDSEKSIRWIERLVDDRRRDLQIELEKQIERTKTAVERTELAGHPPNLDWLQLQHYKWGTAYEIRKREHKRAWNITWENIEKPLFIEHARTIQKATNMRALYLELLRSPIVKNIKWSNLQNVAYYHKAIDTKRELSCKLDSIKDTGVGVYNDKNIRYINLVITTLDKYIRTYLDMKTAVSVEILRVLPDKYIDRYIMEFL